MALRTRPSPGSLGSSRQRLDRTVGRTRRSHAGFFALIGLALVACDTAKTEPTAAAVVAYRDMTAEPALSLRPPKSTLLSKRQIPPCEGDSGFGPAVLLEFDVDGDLLQVAEWYKAKLPELGWTVEDEDLSDELPSTAFAKTVSGTELLLVVRYVGDAKELPARHEFEYDFDASLYAPAFDNC